MAHVCVYTSTQISALWRTSEEALNQLFCLKEISYLKKKKSIFLSFEKTNFFHVKKASKILFHTSHWYFLRSNKPCLRDLYFSHFIYSYLEQTKKEYNDPSTQPSKITSAFFIVNSAKGYRSTQLTAARNWQPFHILPNVYYVTIRQIRSYVRFQLLTVL